MKSRRRLGRAMLVLATALLLVAIDVMLGQFVRWTVEEAHGVSVENERRYRSAHWYYHHDLKAGEDVTVPYWGPKPYEVRTNSLGYRDAVSRDVPMSGPQPRIMLVGDSFIEGMGVAFHESVAGRLAERLGFRGVELLNAAVGSYSPAIYWKKTEYWLEQRGLRVDAVVLFLDISDIFDESLRYRVRNGRVVDAPAMDWEPEFPWTPLMQWGTHSLTYRAFQRQIPALVAPSPSTACSMPSNDCRAAWTMSERAMIRYGHDGLRRADTHMTELAALLRRHRIPLTIVVYPWPQQLRWFDRNSIQIRHWREWADREGADFKELFTTFFAETTAPGVEAAIERDFIRGDVHWTPEGHRRVADAIGPYLDRLAP